MGLTVTLVVGLVADCSCSRINVTFIDKDGEKIDLQVAEGDNLLDIAQANDLEMEGSEPVQKCLR